MDDVVDASHCTGESLQISHISYEEAKGGMVTELQLHFRLLELISREDNYSRWGVQFDYPSNEGLSEGSSPSRDEQ